MIKAENLTKNFKSYQKTAGIKGSISSLFKREYQIKSAVDNFNLDIKTGEIIGLLGPNGAGKTTLMKMMTGIIIPSSGKLEVLGLEPAERQTEFKKNIALVMGQKSQLWWDIPAMDSFLLLQKYYEISDKDFKSRLHMMSELLDVKKLLEVHVRKLSLGERMKMELMASLLHSPKVLFLDEPTIGLDLVAQERIRKFVREYHAQNEVTIVLTSHYMADVSELCEKIVLIFDGKKGFDGPIEDFEKILGEEKSVSFHFSEAISDESLLKDYKPKWNEQKNSVDLLVPKSDLRKVSASILEKMPVTDFQTEKLPIEKVMKTLLENPEILSR